MLKHLKSCKNANLIQPEGVYGIPHFDRLGILGLKILKRERERLNFGKRPQSITAFPASFRLGIAFWIVLTERSNKEHPTVGTQN